MLDILATSFVGDESTFMLGLEANRKNRVITGTNEHLACLKNLPMPSEGVRRLLSDLREDSSEQASHYVTLLNHADPCLVKMFQKEIADVLKDKGVNVANLSFYTDLCSDPKDIIMQKLQSVIQKMNAAESFNRNHFILGKQMIELMAKRELIGDNEVLYRLQKMKRRLKLTQRDLYDIVLAGVMRMEAAIPKLVVLLTLHSEDDIFSEEVVNALARIGTDEVVNAVRPLIEDNQVCFHAIDILGNIKTDYAKKVLLDTFHQSNRSDVKTMIAASLCEQFSAEAIPVIEEFIDEGYERWLLPLERHLYCNCVVNGVDHPKLKEWKLVGENLAPDFSDEHEADDAATLEEVTVQETVNEDQELSYEKTGSLEEQDSFELETDESEEDHTKAETIESEERVQYEEVELEDISNETADLKEEKEPFEEDRTDERDAIDDGDVSTMDEQMIDEFSNSQMEETQQVPEEEPQPIINQESVMEESVDSVSQRSTQNELKDEIVEDEHSGKTEEEKKKTSQKRSERKQTQQKVSNEEIQAAMERLLKIRNQNEAQKKVVKVGRNDPCPCGSGKKYKKCCL